jgi:7SK snRNA methylphosphate capping enzyme
LDELSKREGPGKFEVVLLFSVTKWLHLHWGDSGMYRLFQSLYSFLPTGGIVIVEPQERENYARAVRKNKDLKEVYKGIQFWPPFEKEMTEVGFKLKQRIERVEGGFSRPLLVWRKE